jgi:hypothetical protein
LTRRRFIEFSADASRQRAAAVGLSDKTSGKPDAQ